MVDGLIHNNADAGDARPALQATHNIGVARVVIGFMQGIVAWQLLSLVPAMALGIRHQSVVATWPLQHPQCYAALTLITAYLPVIAIVELGRMRWRRLLVYLMVTGCVVAGLAAYDIWRDPVETYTKDPRLWPSFQVCFCVTLGLFIVSQLLEHRERGDSLFSNYAEHFEDSWLRGFQLVISFVFALITWGVLLLGAELFALIHISEFRTMISHNWFRCPALAVAFAGAIHVTDVRPAILRGVRNVALTLLSFLLPLIAMLAVGFLVALLFKGLQPLWATRRAGAILLWACALNVFFLNAAYKDGDPVTLPRGVMRWAGSAAGPAVLVLAALAAYAIGLRVHQYGFTPERVFSSLIAVVALTYGAGYGYAAARGKPWLRLLETVNVVASLLIVALLTILLTPLADPARLSVNSQLSRLSRGAITADRFDYQFLRFDSGIYGRRALERLASSADADTRGRASRMLAATSRFFSPTGTSGAITEPAFAHATIYPAGARLPDDFRTTDWSSEPLFNGDCLKDGAPCDIYILSVGDPAYEVVLIEPTGVRTLAGGSSAIARLYQRDGAGKWEQVGSFDHMNCPGVVASLQQGHLSWMPPDHDDLVVNGMRLRFSPTMDVRRGCTSVEAMPTDPARRRHDARAPLQMGPAFGLGGH